MWGKVLNKYIPIEYDETTKVWATLTQDEKGRWYRVQPAPLKYGLGPYQENPAGIIVNSDTEEPAQDYNQTPVAPVDTMQGGPSLAPQDTCDTGAKTPTNPKTATIMATTTQTKASTTTATTYATVTAGRGGGSGRGGASAGHPANGKLIGNPPHDFTGDRTWSKKFLLEFELYQQMNSQMDQVAIPHQ